MVDDRTFSAKLLDRAVLWVAGQDAEDFLQNLITNDVAQLSDKPAIYSALLTAQGKFLFDFFVSRAPEEGFLLECEAARLPDLIRRLTMYKLRADVSLQDVSGDYAVYAIWGAKTAPVGDMVYQDPRTDAAGYRLLSRTELPHGGDDYDAHRLSLGLSNGSDDIQVDKNFFLEANGDIQSGVAFDKGCFVGQETTARMKHRDLVRKRLMPLALKGGSVEPGAAVHWNGKSIGEIRSTAGTYALAQIGLADVMPGDQLAINDISAELLAPAGWEKRGT